MERDADVEPVGIVQAAKALVAHFASREGAAVTALVTGTILVAGDRLAPLVRLETIPVAIYPWLGLAFLASSYYLLIEVVKHFKDRLRFRFEARLKDEADRRAKDEEAARQVEYEAAHAAMKERERADSLRCKENFLRMLRELGPPSKAILATYIDGGHDALTFSNSEARTAAQFLAWSRVLSVPGAREAAVNADRTTVFILERHVRQTLQDNPDILADAPRPEPPSDHIPF